MSGPGHTDLAVALRRTREARRLSRRELAAHLHVSEKTLGRWEHEGVPRAAFAVVEDFLNNSKPDDPTLSRATDAELLAEIALRLSRTNNPKESE